MVKNSNSSKVRPRMSVSQRAKQFMPFAAVTGLEAALRDKARQIEREGDDMTIGANIRAIRKDKHVNKNMLSFRTKIPEIELRQIEHDKITPTDAQIRAIAAALGVNVSDIIG